MESVSDLHFAASSANGVNTALIGVDGTEGDSITLAGVSVTQAESAHYLFSAQT